MAIELYSQVILMTARYRNKGVSAGARGHVLETYEDGTLKVEFSNIEGTPIAQIVVLPRDVIIKEEHKKLSSEEIKRMFRDFVELVNNTSIVARDITIEELEQMVAKWSGEEKDSLNDKADA